VKRTPSPLSAGGPPGAAMLNRLGLGPVFVYESLLNARRRQVYAVRSLFVLMLLAGMVVVWIGKDNNALRPGGGSTSFRQMAEVGRGFFYALTGVQVSLVLLAAPAAAAGSICMDRARGTLLHMLVTDLSDAEIVLGKLGSRLAPVLGLIACGVPVSALAALLGGIEFGALGGAVVVCLALAVLGCALALALSVWATKTHEVLMGVYAAQILWLIAPLLWWSWAASAGFPPPPDWFQNANPYVLVFAPYNRPGSVGALDYAAFAGGALGISAALAGLTVLRLRPAVVGQSGRPEEPAGRGRSRRGLGRLVPEWAGPSLDGNPVLWREWHRNRPSRFARRLWLLLLALPWALAAWGTYELIRYGPNNGPGGLPFAIMLQLLLGLLMLSATAPTALAEERTRGSLDVLLATPLTTRSIVVAKWWGAFRGILLMLPLVLYVMALACFSAPGSRVLPAGANLPRPVTPLTFWDRGLTLAVCSGHFLASGALIVSLGLALATWVRQLGRAVAFSVIAFFLTGIGWLILIQLIRVQLMSTQALGWGWQEAGHWVVECLMSLSPLFGTLAPLNALHEYSWEWRRGILAGMAIALLVKAGLAILVFWLTVMTFDRCLGRVPESPYPDVVIEPRPREELVPDPA
jgi:ABC-type transport system involved in multi-copper enzyme maturation permease subunit